MYLIAIYVIYKGSAFLIFIASIFRGSQLMVSEMLSQLVEVQVSHFGPAHDLCDASSSGYSLPEVQ